jgi:DNA-binding NtrC family response regulator
LLHVLQDGQITKLGSNRTVDVDVRVIAATNQHLESMMRAGTFREDLYYRIQVIELRLPPLRDRREEIPAFVEFFLAKYAAAYRRAPVRPSDALMRRLADYSWPGNIRELENMMKRFVVLQDENFIQNELARLAHDERPLERTAPPPRCRWPTWSRRHPRRRPTCTYASGPRRRRPRWHGQRGGRRPPGGGQDAVLRLERDAIAQALVRFRWNRRKAASHLRVSYKTLLNKMKECGITDPEGT